MNKVVLVTGASSGFGRSTCKLLAEKGNRVYGTGRKVQSGDQVDGFTMVQLDVNDDLSVKTAIQFVIEQEGRLDVLVNNAGYGIVGSLEDTSIDEIKALFETNVHGVLRCCKAALPEMRKNRSGLIINVSSIAGEIGLPFRGAYSASKAVVIKYTEALSMEVLDDGIRVCVVEPGDFKTNVSENRRYAADIGTHYKDRHEHMKKQIDQDVASSGDPIAVAQAIERIVRSGGPKLRYRVAPLIQRMAPIIKRILPGRTFERMVKKDAGL